ncbi:hypothetical protein ACN261_13130 [Micromonospora sp. WMMD723]|uniref:hypothetical protein n=1 Tax=unclassified Micromonospora TaxID=2617518 RepID=UPI003B957595
MIERGSGRTSGLTDWQLMDVLSMWACLQDQETPGHWKHVAGWRKVCELAQNHLRQLRQYRAGLAEAWPPATNAAARTYLGELDGLINKVQRTHDTAAANHDALAAVARAIDSTRPELKRIRDDYAEKLARKRGYEATLADPRAAAGSRVVDPPVTDADLERLNVQARGLMFGLSGELQQAQAMLQKPPPTRAPRDLSSTDTYGNSAQLPIIPPIAAIPLSPPRNTRTSGTRDSKTARPPLATQSSNSGPTLGGIIGAPPSPTTSSASTGTHGGSVNPQNSFGVPPAYTVSGRTETTNSSVNRNNPYAESIPRAKPPNHIIGGNPELGPSQPASSGTSRRINPVGGVIGGGGAGLAPTGGAGSRPRGGRGGQIHGLGGFPAIGEGVRTGNFPTSPTRRDISNSSQARPWDPDHPWATDEGVPPVVHPPEEEGPIDPGPTIGINR